MLWCTKIVYNYGICDLIGAKFAQKTMNDKHFAKINVISW